MRALHTILLAAALLASVAGVARNQASAQPLVADLSDHLIAVTTGFSGAKLLLFGAMDPQEGGDIVVVVRGPLRDLVVRRKDRIAGVWINNDAVEYRRVPSYYHLASTRPLTEIANAHVLAGLQIGLDQLRLPASDVEDEDVAAFTQALVRNQKKHQLYREDIGAVTPLAGRLFRTTVRFPSSVPTGSYTATAYLFRNGEVVSAQTTPLVVSRVGIGARLYEYAQRYSSLYGLAAVLMALTAGWLAATVFRRGT